ncbi:oxidoreductase [Catenulispora pinisilvae]|uniref:oxidoreductase n=1 Tax=Catenulispora pinisilvae TaxID=2705253 RepID=UPI001890C688|nr:oxidoreductase [Catenulispora pinisilvae]
MTARTALVTGASSGIGAATSRKLQDLGFTVYGAARRAERLRALTERDIRVLEMDLTDDASLRAGVEKIVAETGRIDLLVNCAGYGAYGALEDVPADEARRQFEVNVLGAVRLIQLVLPYMRTQRGGTIVNVTSVGGKIYTPLGGWYHATKHALEVLSDCLRIETKPFGVNVIVIEPGSIKTEWGAIAAENLAKVSGHGAYSGPAAAMGHTLNSPTVIKRSSDPSVIADLIGKAVTSRRPKTRYVAGFAGKPSLLLRRFLPDRAFDAVISRASGIRS